MTHDTTPDPTQDALLAACGALLREAGGFTLDPAWLVEAGPVIQGIHAAIRSLDALDTSDVEPATCFKVTP